GAPASIQSAMNTSSRFGSGWSSGMRLPYESLFVITVSKYDSPGACEHEAALASLRRVTLGQRAVRSQHGLGDVCQRQRPIIFRGARGDRDRTEQDGEWLHGESPYLYKNRTRRNI